MTTFDSMVSEFRRANAADDRNATHEVMQQIALAGLARGGFFEKAAFYGGTCLRILHGMRRFSEDMDFSLLEPDLNFRFEDYFPAVVEEFKLAGKDVEIKMKHKGQPSAIESAFLKESSDVFDIGFTTEKRLKVKIEVDIDPPPKFATEMRILGAPRNCLVRTYDLPGLFAGKVSAALFRKWKNRVKGRDWYDVAWYISHRVPLDLAHLVERAKESEPGADVSTPEKVLAAFDAKIDAIDFEGAKLDVGQYLMDESELDIWSKDFFRQMVRKIVFKDVG
ncbi:MAG: nucleotidyl transferase AbiEii/AbiGii toxin family protein [Kiritimatiellae bacterium]|nr:nucleotidyl transferase AbiEii/AbiGii toxin family protein [Kiritimatiellia bacterium]